MNLYKLKIEESFLRWYNECKNHIKLKIHKVMIPLFLKGGFIYAKYKLAQYPETIFIYDNTFEKRVADDADRRDRFLLHRLR